MATPQPQVRRRGRPGEEAHAGSPVGLPRGLLAEPMVQAGRAVAAASGCLGHDQAAGVLQCNLQHPSGVLVAPDAVASLTLACGGLTV